MTEHTKTIDQMNTLEISAPNLQSKSVAEKNLTSKQSANALFNFTREFKWLTENLKNKAFVPRYNEEKIDVFSLGDETEICFPMTCFCDIHLKRLGYHMSNYGNFGIGLEKEWGIKAGVQPIQYINIYSALHKDFAALFTKALNSVYEENNPIADYQNFLLINLLYLKPLEGSMRVSDDDYDTRNFHDEKEWRYIPELNHQDDLPLVIPKEHLLSPEAYRSYSSGISQRKELWLNYEYRDIKYLIVTDENYREQLINFITLELDAEMHEKMLLISKIVVWNDIKKDW